jgi:N-acetylglutamate synthase-like GNAT family acetyltransferase
MHKKLNFSPITSQDFDALVSLQPNGWKDIRVIFRLHHGREYFTAFKGVIEGQLIVVGHIIYCGDVAWLGNIIVHPLYRRKGYANLMTSFLMDEIRLKGISKIYLLATALGYPLYHKLGFTLCNHYIFNSIVSLEEPSHDISMIRKCRNSDLPAIYKLDLEAMGYDRSSILKFHINGAWVYEDKSINGFLMPDLGDGLIVAEDKDAGWILSSKRISMGKGYLVLPEEQQTPLSNLYTDNGFQLEPTGRMAYFMYVGKPPEVNTQMIYSRIGGYLG